MSGECKILSTHIVYNMSCYSKIINRTRVQSVEVNFQPEIKLDNFHDGSVLHRFSSTYCEIVSIRQNYYSTLGLEPFLDRFFYMANKNFAGTWNMETLQKCFLLWKKCIESMVTLWIRVRFQYFWISKFIEWLKTTENNFRVVDAQIDLTNLPFEILPAGEWRVDTITSSHINKSKVEITSMKNYYEVKTTTALQWWKKWSNNDDLLWLQWNTRLISL